MERNGTERILRNVFFFVSERSGTDFTERMFFWNGTERFIPATITQKMPESCPKGHKKWFLTSGGRFVWHPEDTKSAPPPRMAVGTSTLRPQKVVPHLRSTSNGFPINFQCILEGFPVDIFLRKRRTSKKVHGNRGEMKNSIPRNSPDMLRKLAQS